MEISGNSDRRVIPLLLYISIIFKVSIILAIKHYLQAVFDDADHGYILMFIFQAVYR